MTTTDTIESLAIELGTDPARKPDENRGAVVNVECWFNDAITAPEIVVEPGVRPLVRIIRGATESRWTWPEAWPHDRIVALIARERSSRMGFVTGEKTL